MHNLARILGQAALVVKEVSFDESSDCQVRIVARKPGFISWLLSLLGIDSTFTLLVYRDRLESMEGSLSGQLKTVVPLKALDTYTFGFTKPVLLVVIAVGLFFMSIAMFIGRAPGLGIFLLLIAIGCFAEYFYKKCLMLTFTTVGANGIFFAFKRSVIEGINVDEQFAERVGTLVKSNYLAQSGK